MPSLKTLAVLAATATLVACGTAGEPSSDGTIGDTSEALFSNDKTAFDYFRAKGLSKEQAAGIVGNLDQESGGDPTAVQAGGPGRGIAQWSVGGRWDHDANDNAVAYASAHGKSVLSLGLQLDFIWYELTTFPGYGLAPLKATTNVTDATQVFSSKFEACGTCLQTKRVQYANAVLAAYGNDPVDSGTDAAPKKDGGAPSADGGGDPTDPTDPTDPADPAADEPDSGVPFAAHERASSADLADTGGCSATPRTSSVGAGWLVLAAGALVLARRRRPR